jgi:hypothetical protein
MDLNEECFQELGEWMDELLAKLPGLTQKARREMEKSGEEPITTTVGLFSFRSPAPRATRSRSLDDEL